MLFEYLEARHQVLDEKFDIDQQLDLENLFSIGFRNFSGVQVNELCFPMWDEKELISHKGLLNGFICYYIMKNYVHKNQVVLN